MKIEVHSTSHGTCGFIVGSCPHCGHDVTFNSTAVEDLHVAPNFCLGQRICPNPKCNGHVFFITENKILIRLYPPPKIKFESKNIPIPVKESIEEAIDCHSHKSFRAAAVMIRRAVDHICKDKNANGNDLYERIEDLRDKVTLPKDFFKGMHNLRMLGNDAAHTEAKVFDEIGEDEVEAGIEFAKKIAEAVYQYGDLLEKLERLKKKHNKQV